MLVSYLSSSNAKRRTPPRLIGFEELMARLNASSNAVCVMETPMLLLLEADAALLINAIFNAIISASATAGNLLIILSILRSSTLHSTANFLLLGLSLSDFGVGVMVEPLYVTVLIMRYQRLPLNCTLVAIYNVSSSFLVVISMFTVTAISMDRYLAIHFHLRYPQFVTLKKVIYLQITLWAASALLTLTRLSSFRIYLAVSMGLVILCLFLTCLAYSRIFIVLRRHQAQIQNQISSETTPKMKHLRKSVINTFYVVFVFLVCFLPHCCLTVITITNSNTPSKSVMLLNLYSTSIILLNSSLNPFIYWWRRREFRETVQQSLLNLCCTDN